MNHYTFYNFINHQYTNIPSYIPSYIPSNRPLGLLGIGRFRCSSCATAKSSRWASWTAATTTAAASSGAGPCGRRARGHGKVGKTSGETMAKPWENHGNTMETPWKNHGKTMEKPMETYGNLWKAMENLSLGEKMLFLGSLDRR